MASKNNRLSKSEVKQYHEEGWIGPFKLISPMEMANLSDVIQKQVIEPVKQQNLEENDYFHNRHLDIQGIWELFSNPELVERVASILGPHLVLWRSNFQFKPPLSDQKEFNYGWDTSAPWHQDCAYYQPSPNVILSAWIAVDEVDKGNGCMQIIPGSHKKLYPHVPNPNYIPGSGFFDKAVDPLLIDEKKAIDVELKPGEFILFSESILHSSVPNLSERRRFGLSPRITVPFVDIGDRDNLKVLMLKGEDYMGDFNVVNPP